MSNFIDNFHWYVLNTKPNQEQRVLLNLLTGGIETVAPKIKSFRINTFTGKKIFYKKFLFPGYIFARFNFLRDSTKVRFTRGLQSVVSFGGNPCIVDDDIILLMTDNIDEDGLVNLGDKLNPGDKVIVNKPYLKDFIGVFVKELSDNARVQILFSTVNYQMKLIVDKHYVSKL